MRRESWIIMLSMTCAALGALAALAGLFWTPPGTPILPPELYGQGLYRRDTPFVAGGAQGADLLTLLGVVPGMLWATLRSPPEQCMVSLSAGNAWLLYASASLALGTIAFNELFPVYVLLMPLSSVALVLTARRLAIPAVPTGLAFYLALAGGLTGIAWTSLMVFELTEGAFPPASYYTSRPTYALDLGVIAPACLAAAIAVWRGMGWGLRLAVPLLGIAALLLPMMAMQTAMQLRAGVSFQPQDIIPFAGFTLISGGAIWLLYWISRSVAAVSGR